MMQRVYPLLVALLALAGFATPCAAQGQERQPFYVGIGLGQSDATEFCSTAGLGGGAAGCDQKDTALHGFAGYQLNNIFAVELGFRDLGNAQIPGTDVGLRTYDLTAVGTVPIGNISLFGKLGLFRGQAKGNGGAGGITETHTSLTWGAGLQWDVAKSWALRGEIQHYPNMMGGRFGGSTDVNVIGADLLFRF